jgi:hypothetical protein
LNLPVELIYALIAISMPFSFIGVIKKAPVAMFLSGAMITFVFLLTDGITSLGDTQTCTTTLPNVTTCELASYPLDIWVKIIFMLIGSSFMLVGAVIWKGNDN